MMLNVNLTDLKLRNYKTSRYVHHICLIFDDSLVPFIIGYCNVCRLSETCDLTLTDIIEMTPMLMC